MKNFSKELICFLLLSLSGFLTQAAADADPGYPALDNLVWEYRAQAIPDQTTGHYTDSVYATKMIDGKEYFIIKSMNLDSIPLRREEGRVYGYFDANYNPEFILDVEKHPQGEYLLYDFSLSAGETMESRIYVSIDEKGWDSSYFIMTRPNVIIASRQFDIFGGEKKVQKIVSVLGYSDSGIESDVYYYERMYNNYGFTTILVEDIGPVTNYGSYPMPMQIDMASNKVPGRPASPIIHPNFDRVSTRDGKYSYSRLDLGLRNQNQILRRNLVWEYYSENDDVEAVHRMQFNGAEELEGVSYGIFSVEESIIRDKKTGEINRYVPPTDSRRHWLMRENLGAVYTVIPGSAEKETLVYDFTLQPGASFRTGSDGMLEVRQMPPYHYDTLDVKSYSFDGMEAQDAAITEFIGISGSGKGFLPCPYYFLSGASMSEDSPAADCTLVRQYSVEGQLFYTSDLYDEKAKPLLDAFASVEAAVAESDGEAVYYNTAGVKVTQGDGKNLPEGIYIRHHNGRTEKILVK